MPSLIDKITQPHHLRQQYGGIFFVLLIVFSRPDGAAVAGTALFTIGMLIRIYASGFLVKNDRLTTTGPYGFVRNPIYVANLLIGAGLILLSGLYWAFAILAALYFVCYVPGMRVEEENLRRRYGSALDDYAAKVPLIFPRIRPTEGFGGGRWHWPAYVENKELYVTAGLLIGLASIFWRRMN